MAMIADEKKTDLDLEREFVSRLKAGDREAFAELVGRFQKKIFIFAYGFFPNREDALEIVQETFMRVYAKIDRFQQCDSLSGWIYRLAHNICIDYHRKFAKKRALESDFSSVPEKELAMVEDHQAALETRQMRATIDRAVTGLSARQKAVFNLKYAQGMKLQQVADVMNVSLGTVKTLHHRALSRIREIAGAGA